MTRESKPIRHSLWPMWPWPWDTPEQAIAAGAHPPDPNQPQYEWDERNGVYEVGKKPNFVRWYDMWQFRWHWSRDYARFAPGWRVWTFGIFRFHTLPPEGELISRKHIHGFLFTIRIWLPWEIGR